MDSAPDVTEELSAFVADTLANRKLRQREKVAAIVAEVQGLLDGISAIELVGARLGHVTYQNDNVVIQHDAAGNFVRLDIAAAHIVEFHPRQE